MVSLLAACTDAAAVDTSAGQVHVVLFTHIEDNTRAKMLDAARLSGRAAWKNVAHTGPQP